VDPSGDVDVLASLFSGTAFPVWSMINDAGGPALDGLVVPARGTVGVPVDFAVTPLDAWSAIFATHWSFGDGATATDESVSHVYTAPGTDTVATSSKRHPGQHDEPELDDRDRCCPHDRIWHPDPDPSDPGRDADPSDPGSDRADAHRPANPPRRPAWQAVVADHRRWPAAS
jgi:hypothetical protein